jgi:hypothetical protein
MGHGHRLPLEVADRPDVVSPEEFKAAHVAPCQNDEWVPRVQPDEERSNEIQDDIDLAGE